MKFRLLHKTRQRLRIDLGIKTMGLREADVLAFYLEKHRCILRAVVYERTRHVVIFYVPGTQNEVFKALFEYDDEKAAAALAEVPQNNSRQLTRTYQEKLVGMVFVRFLMKYLMPFPIRTAITFFRAIRFILKGFSCLRRGKLEVEVLDALSVTIAMVRGEYATASSIMFLLGIGELLEEWTHKKSVDDLAKSLALNVDKVWMQTQEGEVLVPVSSVKAGDRLVVRTGNIIPLDGKVISGEALVNQASLTGEAVPVMKRDGAYVYGGTVVEEGECIFSVDRRSGLGRYDMIVRMIEESEKLKSDTESRATNLADRLVPYTLAGTALTYLLTRNITKALSVLMVDFSCAIKLCMPLAVLSAMREAGHYNATVKGGKYLEALAKADTIVFDKTGTLTYAQPVVSRIIPCNGMQEEEVLRVAACLEEHYPHSMAKAVVQKAIDRNISHAEMHSEVEYVVAHGISSTIDEKKVIIGSRHFIFEDENVILAEEDEGILERLDGVDSYLYLAIGGVLSGIICISDPLRKEAASVLRKLKAAGIKKTVMMTGDNFDTAKQIAREVGVDVFYAEVLPEDKARFVEEEKKKGKKVIMIGDGINDSPALSASDCGIAISDGAAIAREIADITIAAEDLNELVSLKYLANGLMKRVDSNYRFVLGFNSLLILLGVTGVLPPTSSAFLHNVSTLGISIRSMTDILA